MSFQCPQCGSVVSCMSQVGPKDDDAGLVSLGMRGHWLEMQVQIRELVDALRNARDNLGRDCDPQRTIMQINAALARAGEE